MSALPLRQEPADVPPELCPACGGAGWFPASTPEERAQHGRLMPCVCTERKRAQRRLARLRELSNLELYHDQTFASFNRFAPGLQLAYQRALAFAQAPAGWLALLGPCGCGKTHLAAAIARSTLDAERPALFVVVPDLLDHLRAAFSPSSPASYDQRFDEVRSVELLVLDDLGTESATPWAREKLYQLINHRYIHRLATVFTSNLPEAQLDPRVASRMHDPRLPASVLSIQAQDYRRRQERRPQEETTT